MTASSLPRVIVAQAPRDSAAMAANADFILDSPNSEGSVQPFSR
jgi:hypothetical protein